MATVGAEAIKGYVDAQVGAPQRTTTTRSVGAQKRMWRVELPAYVTGGSVVVTAQDGTQTTTTVAAGAAFRILDVSPSRQSFRIVDVGAARARYGYHSATSPTLGWPVAAPNVVQDQGGADDDRVPHTGEIWVASPAPTTLVYVEG